MNSSSFTTTTMGEKMLRCSLSRLLKLIMIVLFSCLYSVTGYPLSNGNLPLDQGQGEVTENPIIYYGGTHGDTCRVIGQVRYFYVHEDGYKQCTPNTCPRNEFGPFQIPGGCIVCCYPTSQGQDPISPTDNGNPFPEDSPDPETRRIIHVLVSCLVLAVIAAFVGFALAIFYRKKYVQRTPGIYQDNLGEQMLLRGRLPNVSLVTSAPSSSTLDSGRASDESLDKISGGN